MPRVKKNLILLLLSFLPIAKYSMRKRLILPLGATQHLLHSSESA